MDNEVKTTKGTATTVDPAPSKAHGDKTVEEYNANKTNGGDNGGGGKMEQVKEKAGQAKDKAQQAKDKVQDKAQEARGKVEDAAHQVQDKAHELQDRAEHLYHVGEERLDEIKAQAEYYNERAVEFIQEKPLMALAIGFGTGYLLGKLAKSRMIW